jgi:hypothetical protein
MTTVLDAVRIVEEESERARMRNVAAVDYAAERHVGHCDAEIRTYV